MITMPLVNSLIRPARLPNDYKYVGEEHDPNSGYYYLRARWMDPARGRFVSVDPWGGDPQAPVSLHRYLYANGSPVSFGDPSGRVTLNELLWTACYNVCACCLDRTGMPGFPLGEPRRN